MQSNPDNSNLQGKKKTVRVIGSSNYRGLNYIENDLKGNENCFELAGGSSYRESTVPLNTLNNNALKNLKSKFVLITIYVRTCLG